MPANTRFQLQRVYFCLGDFFVVAYGQFLYTSADDALGNACIDIPVLNPALDLCMEIAQIAISRDATGSVDETLMRIQNFGKFGGECGGGGGGGGAAGSGDVVGPASSVDNRVATFDGTSGKLIQDNTAWTIRGHRLAAVIRQQ